MSIDAALFWAFIVVFIRCSAMLLVSPVLGGQQTPANIRVMISMALSAALVFVIQPTVGNVPQDIYTMVIAIAQEAVVGLMIGMFISMAFAAFQIAGSFLDMQVGLSSSQVMNPVSGIPSTLLSQFKYMLAMAIFLSIGGHQLLIRAFIKSYDVMPSMGALHMNAIESNVLQLLGQVLLLGIQIAAPVAAVGFIIDAALGFINKAVPQFPAMIVGMPAKIIMGLLTLSIALPAIVGGVQVSVDLATDALWNALRGVK
ncbi:MAG: flagellar biosynthetic protein FliR [Fimbriimonadaceae bacterium]|nr:flagellar biosynthetic protein FliR [Fimbriimonadaceae bacterium]